MGNHQIYIKENGTKTLLTSQKYCDRNIDVIVNVPTNEQETVQFTNIFELETTIVKEGYRVVSSGYTATPSGVAVVFPVTAGTHRIRARGKYVFGLTQLYTQGSIAAFHTNVYESNNTPTDTTFSGTVVANYKNDNSGLILNTDENGDFYIDVTISADCYLGFTMKDMSVEYPTASFGNPIITIDEPVGNGGVA